MSQKTQTWPTRDEVALRVGRALIALIEKAAGHGELSGYQLQMLVDLYEEASREGNPQEQPA